MVSELKNRRSQHRCFKDVGMHCSFLHGNAYQLVTLRNFSNRGIYFESTGEIQPGTFIVLRTMVGDDFMDVTAASNVPDFSISRNDPGVCMEYRSHVVATVQRCVRLDDLDDAPRYGVGAEIQILTDYW